MLSYAGWIKSHVLRRIFLFIFVLAILLVLNTRLLDNSNKPKDYENPIPFISNSNPIMSWDFNDYIYSAAISSNNTYIVAGSENDGIYLLNKSSSTPIWSHKTGEIGRVWKAVDISSDGKYITAGSYNDNKKVFLFHKNSTKLWDNQIGNLISSVAISSNGTYVAAGCLDNKVYLFHKNSTQLWNYTTGDQVKTVSISANGKHIAAGSYDNKVYLFHQNSTYLWNCSIGSEVKQVAISADGNYIVAGSYNKKIYLFNKSSSTPLWEKDLTIEFSSVSISSNGEYIAATSSIYVVGSHEGEVMLFHRSSPDPLWRFKVNHVLDSIKITSDGNYIVAGSRNRNVYLFEKASSTPIFKYTTKYEVKSVDITSNGTYFVSVSTNEISYSTIDLFYLPEILLQLENKEVSLWSYKTGEIVHDVAMSSDGNYIAVGTVDNENYIDGKLYLFNSSSSTPMWSFDIGEGAVSVAISSYGNYIAAGSYDGKIYLFEKQTSTPIWSKTIGSLNIRSVDISLDGFYIVAGCDQSSGEIYLFNKTTSNPMWSYSTGAPVSSVAISSDGTYIAAGGYSGKVYFFNKSSSQPMWSYEVGYISLQSPPAPGNVASVALSSNGSYIVAGCWDDQVYFFNKSVPTPKTPIWNYTTSFHVQTVTMSSNGTYIAAGGSDKTIYFFNKTISSPLWSYTIINDIIYSISISSNGNYIVVGGDKFYLFEKSGSTPLWSYDTGYSANIISISSDGAYFAGGSYKTIYFFITNNLPYPSPPLPAPPLPGSFVLSTSADNPDSDGTFNLMWTESDSANNYSLFFYHKYISVINETVSLIDHGITALNYSFSGLSKGEYYYIVVAYNNEGNVSSNCIHISVQKLPGSFVLSTNADNPDSDGIFNLMWTESDSANNYSIYLHDSYITLINESVIILDSGITKNSYALVGLDNGDYFFIVIAHNEYGIRKSNCIYVNIQSTEIPLGHCYLLFTIITIISLVILNRKKIRF